MEGDIWDQPSVMSLGACVVHTHVCIGGVYVWRLYVFFHPLLPAF